MNKKKMLGTIIGVVAFIALVAGATYAWLTNNLGITNGIYNSKTMNFLVNYTNGTDIDDVPILETGTASTAKPLTVTASLAANSAPGKITIYLNTASVDSDLLNGSIKYSYCIDSCGPADFDNNTQILTTSSSQVPIISDYKLTNTPINFTVYFWLDGSKIGSDQVGKTYSGFISAVATQTE